MFFFKWWKKFCQRKKDKEKEKQKDVIYISLRDLTAYYHTRALDDKIIADMQKESLESNDILILDTHKEPRPSSLPAPASPSLSNGKDLCSKS